MPTRVAGRRLDGFEPETTRVVAALLPDATTFFDVGANTGLFALAAAADSQRRVVGFEPVPQIATALRRQRSPERLSQFARRSLRGERLRRRTDAAYSADKIEPARPSASAAEGFKSETYAVQVPAVTLDGYVAKHAINRVDVIKLDTETTEDRVLRGAVGLIRRDAPAIVCEVLHQGHRPSIADVLAELLTPLGYRYFWIKPEGLVECIAPLGDPTGKYMNYLFITAQQIAGGRLADRLGSVGGRHALSMIFAKSTSLGLAH